MEGRFRFLSRWLTRYSVIELNTLASGPRCGVTYGRYDAVWNNAFVGPLNLSQKTNDPYDQETNTCNLTKVTR